MKENFRNSFRILAFVSSQLKNLYWKPDHSYITELLKLTNKIRSVIRKCDT